MKKNHYVYLIYDIEKDKFYVGKRTTRKNIEDDDYLGSGNIILNIKRKYKNDKDYLKRRLVKTVLEVSENEKENAENELKWCWFFNASESKDFYNIASGGTGGHTIAGYTEEQRRKFGEAVSKRNKGKFTGKNNPMYGKGGLVGSKNPRYGKPSWNRGKKPTPETIEKLRNVPRTEEWLEKMRAVRGERASFYGKKHTQEYKDYMSRIHSGENNPVAKKVMLVNTGEIFISTVEGGKRLGIHASGIGKCCNGQTKSAGKINGEKAIWRFVE